MLTRGPLANEKRDDEFMPSLVSIYMLWYNIGNRILLIRGRYELKHCIV